MDEDQHGETSTQCCYDGFNVGTEMPCLGTYLVEAVLYALSLLVCHLYDLPDLLDEGLQLALKDEFTLDLMTALY